MGTDGPGAPLFSLEVDTAEGGPTTIAVAGELDLVTTDQLIAAVRDALAAGDVTIDLAGVTFMDSSGIRALNTAMQEAAAQRRELRVRTGEHPSVVQVLEMTGMMALLPVER